MHTLSAVTLCEILESFMKSCIQSFTSFHQKGLNIANFGVKGSRQGIIKQFILSAAHYLSLVVEAGEPHSVSL